MRAETGRKLGTWLQLAGAISMLLIAALYAFAGRWLGVVFIFVAEAVTVAACGWFFRANREELTRLTRRRPD